MRRKKLLFRESRNDGRKYFCSKDNELFTESEIEKEDVCMMKETALLIKIASGKILKEEELLLDEGEGVNS